MTTAKCYVGFIHASILTLSLSSIFCRHFLSQQQYWLWVWLFLTKFVWSWVSWDGILHLGLAVLSGHRAFSLVQLAGVFIAWHNVRFGRQSCGYYWCPNRSANKQNNRSFYRNYLGPTGFRHTIHICPPQYSTIRIPSISATATAPTPTCKPSELSGLRLRNHSYAVTIFTIQ